jgi:transposase
MTGLLPRHWIPTLDGTTRGRGRFLVEAHLREGRSVAELAAAHGVHRSWIYKLLARYRADGWAGLEPRSRRPVRSPTRITDRFEDEIVARRKQLAENGFDAGAVTIHHHLTRGQRHVAPTAPGVRTAGGRWVRGAGP